MRVEFSVEVGPKTRQILSRILRQGDTILAEIDDLRREVVETRDKFSEVVVFIQGMQISLIEIKAALDAAIAAAGEASELRVAAAAAADDLNNLQASMESIIHPVPPEEPAPTE